MCNTVAQMKLILNGMLTRASRNTRRTARPTATVFTTNLTRTDLGPNRETQAGNQQCWEERGARLTWTSARGDIETWGTLSVRTSTTLDGLHVCWQVPHLMDFTCADKYHTWWTSRVLTSTTLDGLRACWQVSHLMDFTCADEVPHLMDFACADKYHTWTSRVLTSITLGLHACWQVSHLMDFTCADEVPHLDFTCADKYHTWWTSRVLTSITLDGLHVCWRSTTLDGLHVCWQIPHLRRSNLISV